MGLLRSNSAKLRKNLLHLDRFRLDPTSQPNSTRGRLGSKSAKLRKNLLHLGELPLVLESRHRNDAQIRLPAEIWHLILTEYIDKPKDILSFALAHGSGYKRFDHYLYRCSVRYGGCSALKWAAMKGDWEMAKGMLQVPEMEMFVPKNMWHTVLKAAQEQNNMELARLLFAKQTVQTCIENAAASMPGSRLYGPVSGWHHLTDDQLLLQPMFDAAKNGQESFIKLYLTHVGVDVHIGNGWTALHYAASSGHTFLVKYLKDEHNANPDPQDPYTCRPIEAAAEGGHLSTIELLLSYGVDPRSHGTSDSLAFLLAAKQGRDNVVEFFLKDDRIDANKYYEHTNLQPKGTPLGLAVLWGRDKTVSLLLADDRIDPNVKNLYDIPPLLLASSISTEMPPNEAVLGMLLKHERVDVTAVDDMGRNLCAVAASNGHYSLIKMILDDGRIDPNQGDNEGITPVMYAAFQCARSLELLLKDKRVDLEKKRENGETALLLAVKVNAEENVKQLLNSGRLDADQASNSGNTPLTWACHLKNLPIVKLLLDTGSVDLDKRNKDGMTPLMLAIKDVWYKDTTVEAIVKLLLDRGRGLIDHQFPDGTPIVQYAAEKYQKNIFKMFLETGEISVDSRASWICPHIGDMLAEYQEKQAKDEEKQRKREERRLRYRKWQAKHLKRQQA